MMAWPHLRKAHGNCGTPGATLGTLGGARPPNSLGPGKMQVAKRYLRSGDMLSDSEARHLGY